MRRVSKGVAASNQDGGAASRKGLAPANIGQHVAQNSLPQESSGNTRAAGRGAAAAAAGSNQAAQTSKVMRYIDDYRSPADAKALRDEGYEIDYDRLVGIGNNSAVFLAHSVHVAPPPLDRIGQRPLYTPGYDIAAKVIAKKWINTKRPSKTRTGNLKLALALGQTKNENNILKVIDVFKTAERIFIFMQYCAYGNVISFIRRNGQVSANLTQRWSGQMAAALSFLHKFHVAHRNYKLENVLVDENLNAKLTGFGLSKFCIDLQTKQPVMSKTICGSEPYLAPEMLKESNERCYDPKQADVWAFGVGVFLCSTRRYPFEAENLRALKAEQLTRRYLERDTKRRLKPVVRDLLAKIFIIEPGQRPTMHDLINQSAWLNPGLGSEQPSMGQQQQQQQQQLLPQQARPAQQVIRPTLVSIKQNPSELGRPRLLRSNASRFSDVSQASAISGAATGVQSGAARTDTDKVLDQSPTRAGAAPRPQPITKFKSNQAHKTSGAKQTVPAGRPQQQPQRPLPPQQQQQHYPQESVTAKKDHLNPVTPVSYPPNDALPQPNSAEPNILDQ